jgi:GrpB-like predicted nucleotidyltransferase (UPF0157 family)
VAGLEAKPVLDLMPALRALDDDERIAPAMAKLGYEYRGEFGIPGRRYFKLASTGESHVWQHNVHSYVKGHIEWMRHIVFRDALRSHSDLRDDYTRLKRDLAQRYEHNVDSYARAKSEFVESIIARFGGPARDWR